MRFWSTKPIVEFNKARGTSDAIAYAPVIPFTPSMKLITLDAPTHTIRARATIHHMSQCRIFNWKNIITIATNWATRRTLSGNERISSMKLTPAMRVTANRNHKYWKPKKALQIHSDNRKIRPPPLRTMLEWELLSFGLSIILNLLAILKYANSKTRISTKMIT